LSFHAQATSSCAPLPSSTDAPPLPSSPSRCPTNRSCKRITDHRNAKRPRTTSQPTPFIVAPGLSESRDVPSHPLPLVRRTFIESAASSGGMCRSLRHERAGSTRAVGRQDNLKIAAFVCWGDQRLCAHAFSSACSWKPRKSAHCVMCGSHHMSRPFNRNRRMLPTGILRISYFGASLLSIAL